jgi:hypothetical protein
MKLLWSTVQVRFLPTRSIIYSHTWNSHLSSELALFDTSAVMWPSHPFTEKEVRLKSEIARNAREFKNGFWTDYVPGDFCGISKDPMSSKYAETRRRRYLLIYFLWISHFVSSLSDKSPSSKRMKSFIRKVNLKVASWSWYDSFNLSFCLSDNHTPEVRPRGGSSRLPTMPHLDKRDLYG